MEANRAVLQKWLNENEPEDKMLWKRGYWQQGAFVRDMLMCMMEDCVFDIPSNHTSKSIKLPVYRFSSDKLTVIMRENFYGWVVSVKSLCHIDSELLSRLIVSPDEDMHECCCEGFKKKWVYPARNHGLFTFTARISNDYDLYTLLLVITSELEEVKGKQL